MIEILADRDVLNEDGDVMPIEDYSDLIEAALPEVNESEHYEWLISEEETRQKNIQLIRAEANFQPRNATLEKMGSLFAQSCRSEGAAYLYASGVDTSDIRGARRADAREVTERIRAIELAEVACKLCPLSAYCDLNKNDALVPSVYTESTNPANIAQVKKNRDRLRRRVEKDNFKKNNHFCQTNMRDSRLSDKRP